MKGYQRIALQITNLLRAHPRGMTITDISQNLHLNRNSVAKYLEILVISGQVEKQAIGRAKLFSLSQRVPISAMLNLSSDMILILDEESRIWYVNENLLAFEGKERADLIGKGLGDTGLGILTDPEIMERAKAPLEEQEYQKEVVLARKDGTFFFTISLVSTIFEDGSRGITIIIEDITERKRAEEALTRSERRYRSLFEHMLDGYAFCRMIYDLGRPSDFLYLDVNPAFGRITGLKDVVGKKVSAVIPGIQESNPEIFEIYGRVASTGRPERFETYLPGLGILFSISVFSPEKGHFVAAFEDITEWKRTEERLTEHLHFFQELLDRVPSPVFYKDMEGHYLGCNRAFEEFAKRPREEILDRKAADILPAELANRFEAMDASALKTGTTQSLESAIQYNDGTNRDFIVFKAPFQNQDGSRGGIVGTIFDITGWKKTG